MDGKRQRLRRIATPYSFAETMGVVWRNVAGPDHRNRGGPLRILPQEHRLHPLASVELRIAFLGDIMSVGAHRLAIGGSVAAFLSGSDALVANLEATICAQRRRPGVLFGALQRQDTRVAGALADLFPPAATYLSVANNHAGDFEERHYGGSCALLEERGFHLFGRADRPHADIGAGVRLHAGTMWSNQICTRIHRLGPGPAEGDERRVNILFPHWGYELETYPRPEIVAMAKEYCLKFDAILGHHPHTVQPVTMECGGGRERPIAYSLGDFCTDIRREGYRHGIIAKLEVGPAPSGEYRIGGMVWRFVECRRVKDSVEVRIADCTPPWLQ